MAAQAALRIAATEGTMTQRDGLRLAQTGVLLFLLALVVGIGVPRFTLPRLALSVHLLGIMQGTFLLAAALWWPSLALGAAQSRVGQVLAIYGCAAAWLANLAGAAWGAGASMVPIAAGGATGTPAQEMVIRILLRSAAVCLVAFAAFFLWALSTSGRRTKAAESH